MGRIRGGLAALAMLGAWALPAAALEVQSVKLPERVRFAVLEDLSVDPAIRSLGTGALMVAEIEAEARRREMGWIFLESGRENLRAHSFFERHGFGLVSETFGKRL